MNQFDVIPLLSNGDCQKILFTGWYREQGKIIEPISVYGPSPVNQDCHSHSWGSQFPESTQLPMVQGVFEFAPRIGIEKIRISYSPKFRDEARRVTANRSTIALLDNAEFWPTEKPLPQLVEGKHRDDYEIDHLPWHPFLDLRIDGLPRMHDDALPQSFPSDGADEQTQAGLRLFSCPVTECQSTRVAALTIFVEQHENFRLQPLLAGFAPPKLLTSTQIHGSLFKKLPCTKNPASIMRPC